MKKTLLLLNLFLFLFTITYAQTNGELEAVGKDGKRFGLCPLKHTDVKAEISGFLSRVRVTQEFENNFEKPIEAVYVFPLPQDSAVDEMTMKIGSRTIRGKIMKREEARKIYEAAKNAGQTASLLDQERPNIFTQAVANIMPNEKIIIEISYVETLKYEDGSYEFMFPMVVGPRYKPASMTTEQKQSITPPVAVDTRAGHDISISVNLNAGVPIEEIRSTSHEIETNNLNSNTATIKLKDAQTIPNKDFILRYDVAGKKINDAVLTHNDGKGGYFTLILQPPDKVEVKDVSPKEIVFVLDTSGSMNGFPIEKAKESMKMALNGLYPNDTFNLITFAGDTAVLFDKPVPSTKANLKKAQNFLASRQGGGGTEMMKAIQIALEPSDSNKHLRIVCFMTDGDVGNEGEILSEIQKHPNARVFSFGIGSSVNRFLLDKMANEGRGEVEYVSLKDDGTKAAKRFHERIRNPLLTDISIDWNGLQVADVYPKKINDLFSAKPLIIHGRYTKSGSATIKLKGKFAGREIVREIPVNFPNNANENDVLATLWARTRINDLMSNDYNSVAQNGKTQSEIEQTITQIGLEYRLMTQFTSFVAVEEKVVNKDGKSVRVDVPVELPEGVSKLAIQEDADEASPTKAKVFRAFSTKDMAYIMTSPSVGIGGGQMASAREVIKSECIGYAKPDDIKSRIQNLNLAIQGEPNSSGIIRVSGPARDRKKQIAAVNKALDFLARQGWDKTRYRVVDGGDAPAVSIEFIHIPPGVNSDVLTKFSDLSSRKSKVTKLEQKLHFWLYQLVERLQKGESKPTENEAKFVKDGKANILINLTAKTPKVIEKLKQLGFEILTENETNLTGRIAIEKLAQLVEIEEVQLILPNLE